MKNQQPVSEKEEVEAAILFGLIAADLLGLLTCILYFIRPIV